MAFPKGHTINKGRIQTKEHRKHTSEVVKKQSRFSRMYGKKHSEQTKIKMRDSAKLKNQMRGTKISDRAKLEEIAGRPIPNNCEICGAEASSFKKRLHFDHSHKTGRFRGWICNNCNWVLGLVKDNKEVLQQLIEYLLMEDFINSL